MSSQIADVAEAVKDALNAAVASSGLSQTFVAERVYVPVFDLRELEDIGVRVVPNSYLRTRNSRRTTAREIPIDIGIAKRVPEDCNPQEIGGNTELDAHLLLVEEIADLFDRDTITEAEWLRSEVVDPIYDLEKLRSDRTALSVVRVTFVIY